MVSYFDMPKHFYYPDLGSALEGFHISADGIHQIQTLLPVSNPKDREILRALLMRLVAQVREGGAVTDISEGQISYQLKVLGLSDVAVYQLYNALEPVTDPRDRLTLLGVLAAGLVRNEAHVPRGLTGPHRMLWVQNQLKKNK